MKLSRNNERDHVVTRALRQEGWTVLPVWECDLARNHWPRVARRVVRALGRHGCAVSLKRRDENWRVTDGRELPRLTRRKGELLTEWPLEDGRRAVFDERLVREDGPAFVAAVLVESLEPVDSARLVKGLELAGSARLVETAASGSIGGVFAASRSSMSSKNWRSVFSTGIKKSCPRPGMGWAAAPTVRRGMRRSERSLIMAV